MQIMETISWFGVKPCVCEREREIWESPGPSHKLSDVSQPSHGKELNQDTGHQVTAFKWVIASESPSGLVEELEREIQESVEETANIPLSLIFIVCFFLSARSFLMVPQASVRIPQQYISLSVFFPSLTTHRSFLLL